MNIFQIITCLIKTHFKSRFQKDLEILALRSQLAVFQQHVINHKITKPRLTDRFRRLWIFLSKNLPNWQDALVIVKPKTVIGWHKRLFKFYWRRKSRGGRPKISPATIALIKRIHKENPTLSPEQIHERLIALSITDAPAPNTIARYIRDKRKRPTEKQVQSWQTFLRNHAKSLWSMDFFVTPTLTFQVLYVLIIVSHDRRKIEHFAVTTQPSSAWMIQQIRNATPFDNQPEYIIHDNFPAFKEKHFQQFLADINIKSKSITPFCPWQNGVAERLVGIVRRELLDFAIPINQRHLEKLLAEYVNYYNNVRTHQTLGGQMPIVSDPPPPSKIKATELSAKPILGGLYHNYEKVA
ncbi:MAG: integrase core domain-containing protein [Clostridiales bacterium]|jgi:transposase InsO family protein|nr:integrase core domain-containing protein [Clostridiales bacterium]